MSRLDDLVISASEALDACGLGAEAEELLEHGVLALDRAYLALAAIPWPRCVSNGHRAARDALDALAPFAPEGPESTRPTLPVVAETFDPCVGAAGVCS